MEIKKLRLMTIVGTRPEIIKMSEIIKKRISTLTRFLSTPDKTTTTS